MPLFITVAIVFAILLVNELWWRLANNHGEISRKLAHILVGSFVAFWPFYLSWREIQLLSVAFFVVVFISKYLHIFHAIHSVQRPTWGELFFALSVGAITLITQDKWIYMSALLMMSLADGLAAIIGSTYGKKSKYSILGHTKSLIGNLTFLIVSILILTIYWLFAPHIEFSYMLVVIPLATMVLENFSVYGIDNLLVPVATAVLLKFTL